MANRRSSLIGLELVDTHAQIKTCRLWKLKYSLDDIVRRRAASGHTLEILVGCSVHFMACRSALAVFDRVFAVICSGGARVERLGEQVRRKLRHAGALPP